MEKKVFLQNLRQKSIAILSQSYLCHKVKAADRYIKHKKVKNKLVQHGVDVYLKKEIMI